VVEEQEEGEWSGEEHKEAGGLAWAVYRAYGRAVGGALASGVLLSLLLMQGLGHAPDTTLATRFKLTFYLPFKVLSLATLLSGFTIRCTFDVFTKTCTIK